MPSDFKFRQPDATPPATSATEPTQGRTVDSTAPMIPSDKSVRTRRSDSLSVTWIHGVFQAAVYRRQHALAIYSRPGLVRSMEDFSTALRAAVAKLEFRGVKAALVFEREEFSHQMESVPPASRRVQHDYIRNRALRNGGPVAQTHSYQRTYSPKQEQNVILHLLPTTIFTEIVGAFETLNLRLEKVFPYFALIPLQLQRLGLERDEIVLMVTENAGVTSMVSGRRDGQILFGRAIFNDWRRDANRAATEINRSILFARQRFGITIDTVFLVGESVNQARESLLAQLDRTFVVKTHECPNTVWLSLLQRLPAGDSANLLAERLQQQARRKLVRFVFTSTLWLLFTLAGLSALRAEWNYQLQLFYFADLQRNRAKLEETLTVLADREASARHSAHTVSEVIDKREPPVAAGFMRWIGPQLPDFLRLTQLQISWQPAESAWMFRIEGLSRADVETTLTALTELERLLAAAPFRAFVLTNNQVELGSFVSRRSTLIQREFFIEGRLFAQ